MGMDDGTRRTASMHTTPCRDVRDSQTHLPAASCRSARGQGQAGDKDGGADKRCSEGNTHNTTTFSPSFSSLGSWTLQALLWRILVGGWNSSPYTSQSVCFVKTLQRTHSPCSASVPLPVSCSSPSKPLWTVSSSGFPQRTKWENKAATKSCYQIPAPVVLPAKRVPNIYILKGRRRGKKANYFKNCSIKHLD